MSGQFHKTGDFKGNKNDPARTRTWNLRFRRPMPYPLGHRATLLKQLLKRHNKNLDVYVSRNSDRLREKTKLTAVRFELTPFRTSA